MLSDLPQLSDRYVNIAAGVLGERGKLPCGVPHSPRRGSGHKVAAQEEFIFRFSFSYDTVDLVSHFPSSP